MARTIMVSLVAGLLMAASPTLEAQRWGRERTPRDGACFYRDTGFRGDYFCARAGETLDDLPFGMNNEISSIRIFGRAEVTVYRGPGFSGRRERFDRDVYSLRQEGWNDLISSARLGRDSYGDRGGRNDRNDRYDRNDRRDRDDRGSARRISSDEADRIVRRAYQDVLEREPDQAGLRLYRSRMVDDGWSEAQVREALRTSPENRQQDRMTLQKAEEIVRRAYLAVLGREPDAGKRGYVDKVFRERWTQQDVERELRKSPEYRGR